MPVEIEFVGGPADGHRMTIDCTPEDLPAAYDMPTDAGWAGVGPTAAKVAKMRGGRSARYERGTAAIGPTWHFRYEGRGTPA